MNLDKSNKKLGLLAKLLIVVIAVWIISCVLIILFLDSWSERGAFGDLFGAVNALFSALGFAALIYTISLQRKEIRRNLKEIELNRKELHKSAELQRKSQHVLEQQVEQTHLSAKMNAMRTLIDYYNHIIATPSSSTETIELAKEKRKKVIAQIDLLIDGLDDSEAE